MRPNLPPAVTISTYTIEDKLVTFRGRLATLPDDADPVGTWTVECVISDGEDGPELLTLDAADIPLTDADVPEWEMVVSRAQNAALGSGNWWYNFHRIDSGAGLVISRGPYVVGGATAGEA